MSIGVPIKVLHEAEGHVITCETNTGEVYRDMLKNAPMFKRPGGKGSGTAGRGKSAILRAQARGRGRGQNQRGRGTGSAPWLNQQNQPGGSQPGRGRG
ncbi:hypothetical protein HZH66_012651 [Vespula vulgaris]|uniref:Uncharacterized protein n=1 Tax=Vespula vulgaris TaxID=7454 RepID=A0A834JB95_VESVU|nr:hypothetical protein HZH66_012651 [Vespula vulgaris]